MPNYRILLIKESFRQDELLHSIPTRQITYMVGMHGPFKLELDAKDFTTQKADELLTKLAAEVEGLPKG